VQNSNSGAITLDSTLLAGFRWRNIAREHGRPVSSVTGIPSPSRTFSCGRGWRNLEDDQRRHDVPAGVRQREMRVDG